MNDVYALLKVFGNRYILCDDEQAELDNMLNRDDMVEAYIAIMHYVELLKDKGE